MKIYIGYRHDRLEVIEELDERYHGQKVYLCKCDCGNTKKIPAGSINVTRSCGCLLAEKNKRNFVDLTGRRFDMLTVIGRHGDKNPVRWDCKCDCGKETTVLGGYLVSKRPKKYPMSCGCAIERHNNLKGKKFGYLTVERYVGYSDSQHTTLWECVCICGNKYIVAASNLAQGKVKSCGCMEFIQGTSVSSITRSTLNKNNTSGKRGVSYVSRTQKWKASITFKRHKYHLGTYGQLEDAIKVREIAENKIFGEFLEWYEEYKKELKESKDTPSQ